MTPLIYPSGDLFITTIFIIAKNENVLDSKNEKKMKNSYLPNPVMTSACIINRSNETIFQLIRFRFSQELVPSGTNHSSSTTASIGSIYKECGRLWLDHNGLFGPRVYPPLLLCSHRRHLCLHLLLLQGRQEFKFLSRLVLIFIKSTLSKL